MKLESLDYVVLVVDDLERALGFYRDTLGLSVKHRANAFAQLHTGTTRLALFTRDAMSETLHQPLGAPGPGTPAFELGFKVDDADAAYRELIEAGAPAVTPPETRHWGQRTAYVRDPDGNLIELVS
ncbi:MAG TPA: VOC family protein [Gammaproteobacteria bacterium]|nr:VOC family protein [Gammaproteobacteria bacterium]